MLSEVAAGVLVDVMAAAGRRLGTAASAVSDRRYAKDVAIARWFDTYRLTGRNLEIADLSPQLAVRLAEVLRSNNVQAVLHELLAARLTDAPEEDIEQIRNVLALTLGSFGDDIATHASEIFGYFDAEICTLAGRLEGAEPSLLREIRSEALSSRMVATLHAIERHTAALTSIAGPRTESAFAARYRRQVAEYHGKIEPPDFERRRRVPIADLYVPPTIFQVVDADRDHAPRELSLWHLAEELDRTVLLGDPGVGKSTAANALLHYNAADPVRSIPFMVTLRDYAEQDPPERSVVNYIEHRLNAFYQCPAPEGLVQKWLLAGQALVIFDGLDELLDTSRRADVTARVERFADQYPLARVLVTSRLVGYDQARLDDREFTRHRIWGFSDDQVRDYARKWFAQEEGIGIAESRRWAASFLEESAPTPDLRANPLILALMCILYRGEGSLPRNRTDVYEQCANLLFRKWDARRHIYSNLRAGQYLEPVLRYLAWWLLTRTSSQPAVTEREIVAETTRFLHGRGFESKDAAEDAAAEFVAFCRGRMWVLGDAGTTAAGEPLYSFTHRTFLEYFAAAYLAYRYDSPERLARTIAPHAARHEWEVVGELAIQLKDRSSDRGAQRIYGTMLGQHWHRSPAGRSGILQFLARGLRSVDPSPRVTRRVTIRVLDHLLAGELDDRARALPLSWLLGSCAACKETVSEEIAGRIIVTARSEDPAQRMAGLVLAATLPVFAYWAEDGPRLPPASPLGLFWRVQTAENVGRFRDSIITVAARDHAMRYAALQHGLISLPQALAMPDGLLSLLQMQRGMILGLKRVSYLMNSVYQIVHGATDPYYPGMRDGVAQAIEDLTDTGHYVSAHPQLPWLTGQAQGWFDYFGKSPPKREITPASLDQVAYLGAAATLFISAECTQINVIPGAHGLGPLSDLYPYVEQRQNNARNRLPDLPVPKAFRPVFRDWARNRVHLTAKDLASESGACYERPRR